MYLKNQSCPVDGQGKDGINGSLFNVNKLSPYRRRKEVYTKFGGEMT
jgi:hypothetical protein